MKVKLMHALPAQLSIRVEALDAATARWLEQALHATPGVTSVRLRRRAGRLHIGHVSGPEHSRQIWLALAALKPNTKAGSAELARRPPPAAALAATEEPPSIVRATLVFAVSQVLTGPIRSWFALYGAYPYLKRGLLSLSSGKLGASALDAAAIASSLASGNPGTAGLISYLLTLGTHIEHLTEQRSDAELTGLLRRGQSDVWILRDGSEVKIRQQDLSAGDLVVLRASYVIPVDGVVVRGQALINQAVVTGEAWPEAVTSGAAVYEGAVVVEGSLVVRATRAGEETRLSQMVRIIDGAKHEKAAFESYAERLADSTVPFVMGGAAFVYLLTGDPLRAATALLVDYSCALKLTIPMVFRSAIMQAGDRDILIKGAQWVERLSQVTAVAFDKTGTLTKAWPKVVEVVPVNGYRMDELLRNVACVEEHFSHPIASAIVEAARQAGLEHVVETHGELEYLVSYGIVTSVQGQRFIVGGLRVLDRYAIDVSKHRSEIERRQRDGYSLVFVAAGDQLAGMIVLDDELQGDARRTIVRLRKLGVERIVMLTGDTPENARRVARSLAIEECHAGLFPEQKVALLEQLERQGHTVAMLGDGLNDGPALSTADVGISLASGADLSRELADVVLLGPQIERVVDALALARDSVMRARRSFAYIVGINSALLAAGMLGLIGPARAAFLHNATTILLSLDAARPRALPSE